MESVTQEVQTPEEKATIVFEEAMSQNDCKLTLGEDEKIVASYDFPTVSSSGDCSHEVFLTTRRFVHVEKNENKYRRTKKINAFSIKEIECVDSVVSHHRDVVWALVVLLGLFAIASVIVGLAVTPYAYAGIAVFGVASVLTAVLPKEKRTFSLLISGLSENKRTSEVLTLGVVTFKDVGGDELESGDVEVYEDTEIDSLDKIISEIGAKLIEIKEGTL